MERIDFTEVREIKGRISWGSVIAGVVTVIAMSILLWILGSAIGLFMIDPQSQHPFSGVGTTVGIWSAIAVIISLAAGGFVAGKLAGRDGIIHGFIVWATTMLATIILMVFAAAGAVRVTGNILGSLSSVAGNVISGVGSAVGNGVSGLADQAEMVFGDVDFTGDISKKEVRQEVRQALRKSGVKEFQPEYLNNQFQAIKSDMNRTAKRIITNPKEAESLVDGFLGRVQNRTEAAFKDVNRDDLTKAIANNSNLSKAEVDRAVNEYADLIQTGIEEGKQQINNLQESIDEMKQDWEAMKQRALEEADAMSNAAARSALISFFALLIGAAISAYAGLFGTRKTQEGYEV